MIKVLFSKEFGENKNYDFQTFLVDYQPVEGSKYLIRIWKVENLGILPLVLYEMVHQPIQAYFFTLFG